MDTTFFTSSQTENIQLTTAGENVGPDGWLVNITALAGWTGSAVLASNRPLTPGNVLNLVPVAYLTGGTLVSQAAGTALTGGGAAIVQQTGYDLWLMHTLSTAKSAVAIQILPGNISAGIFAVPLVPAGGRTISNLPTYLLNNAVFNVKDFGAKGDGVTDDTAAFAAAAAACNLVNGRLVIPSGTYAITALPPISVNASVELIGSLLLNGVATTFLGEFSSVPYLHPSIELDAFHGRTYLGQGALLGQPAGFVSFSPAPGTGRGDGFSIMFAAGQTVHITDNTWKEGLHFANVGYKTSGAFTTGAIEGVEGEVRIGALNTQNWTGYSTPGIGATAVTGTVVTEAGSAGTISRAVSFFANSFLSNQGVTVTEYDGLYVMAPGLTESGTSQVRNAIGVYIEAITQGTVSNHAIFVNGGTSYFGGAISLGVLVPATPFAIDAEVALTAALPAVSGTTQSNGGRIRLGSATSGTAILDIGLAGGTGAWLQSTSATDLSTTFPMLLNPNGGGVIVSAAAALATSATTGHLYIASCAGTPSGVPASAAAGRIAMVYDTIAHKIWFYDQIPGAWKGVAVA